MKDYKLIKKWLNLDIKIVNYNESSAFIILADQLERRLSEGFEVYGTEDSDFGIVAFPHDTQVALAIGKQPIKKQTQAEAALEFVKIFANQSLNIMTPGEAFDKAKKILEMKDE